MYALYMILLTFDLSTPVKYERLGVYERSQWCEKARDNLALNAMDWSRHPSFWVEPKFDDNQDIQMKEYPMPVRYGCVYIGKHG